MPIKMLLLNHQTRKITLVEQYLLNNKTDFHILEVHDQINCLDRLKHENYEMVLADFSLLSENFKTFLDEARQIRPGIPFLILMESADTECTIPLLEEQAVDVVDTNNTKRLCPAISTLLTEAEDLQAIF